MLDSKTKGFHFHFPNFRNTTISAAISYCKRKHWQSLQGPNQEGRSMEGHLCAAPENPPQHFSTPALFSFGM
jgi:hypothetical protein